MKIKEEIKKEQSETENKIEEQEIILEPNNCDGNCKCKDKDKKHKKDKECQEKIAKLEQEKVELINKIKLSQAELINYRKRKDEEVTEMLKYSNKDIIEELLTIVDNFERAISSSEKASEEVKKYTTGFNMIYQSLKNTLTKFGVSEINNVGTIFNPSEEQALVAENHPDKEDEIVLEVLQKGYKLKDRVIRPASVKVNQI